MITRTDNVKGYPLPAYYFQTEIKTDSQNKIVLKHLVKYGSLTAEMAVRLYRIYRLGARIYDLKRSGHNISSGLESKGSCHWAVYKINHKKS